MGLVFKNKTLYKALRKPVVSLKALFWTPVFSRGLKRHDPTQVLCSSTGSSNTSSRYGFLAPKSTCWSMGTGMGEWGCRDRRRFVGTVRLHGLRFFQWLEDVGIPLFSYHPYMCFFIGTQIYPIKIQPFNVDICHLVGSLWDFGIFFVIKKNTAEKGGFPAGNAGRRSFFVWQDSLPPLGRSPTCLRRWARDMLRKLHPWKIKMEPENTGPHGEGKSSEPNHHFQVLC